jgi:beta-N-acetylhexosaminidase
MAAVICLSAASLTGCQAKPSAPVNPGNASQPGGTAGSVSPPVQQPVQTDPVEAILSRMSLDDKIGQMVVVGMEGSSINSGVAGMIKEKHVGGIILYGNNIVSPNQLTDLANALRQANKDAGNAAPILLSADQEGGKVARLPKEVTPFPSAMEVGRSNDPQAAHRVGSTLGEAMRVSGLNTDYAPVLDIHTNPSNPVIGDRAFGTQADVVSRVGISVMEGMKSQGVIPVVKHFPGHGDTSVDSHTGLPVVEHDLARLRSVELVPFAEAVKKGAPAVMVAHLLMTKLDPDKPASMSSAVIQKLLRDELQFKGVVITDDMTMEAVAKVADIGSAAVQSVLAGADIVLVGHEPVKQETVLHSLASAARSGKIPQSVIDASVYRIVKLKMDFHLTDEAVEQVDVTELNKHIRKAVQ